MKKKLVLLLVTLMCISLCACGGNESSSGNNTTDTKTEENGGLLSQERREVEITMDNWQEYFEEKDVLSVKYNAFDEVEDIYFYKILTIKEGITVDPYKSSVAIELNGHFEHYYVNIDTDTWKFNFEERKGDFEYSPSSEIEEFGLHTYKQGDNEKEYYSVQFCRFGDNMVGIDKDTQRTYVERFFIDEIIRVKGTLVIKE